MDWKDLAKTVGEHAEGLGRLLLGPIGGTVGGIIADILGVDDNPDAIAQALKDHPEQLVELKRIEANHLEQLERLQNEKSAQIVKDRASAREHDIEMTRATGKRGWVRPVLAMANTVGLFTIIGVLAWFTIPQDNSPLFHILLGAVAATVTQIVSFYFGSAERDEQQDNAR